MKKIIILGLVMMLAFPAAVTFAAKDDQKGASEKAYEHADDNAIFNRVGDWFATVGKSDEEKAKIKAERRAERAAKRAEKEAKKKADQVKEKMQEGTKMMEKKGMPMNKGK